MQNALFHERIEDAMDEVIRACGGRKKFATDMWPDKPTRDAHNLIDACLNPDRREKFAPSQVTYILRRGKEVGCHALMNYLAFDGGYEAKPISKDEERDRLTTVVEQFTKPLPSVLAAVERLKANP